MNEQPQFTPDLVYNLISNSPQGRAFVENLAKMNQLQQAAKQFAPQINQFAQNPMQAMQNIGEWAQGAVNQMNQPQQQEPAQSVQPQQPQQGGAQVGGGMMGMAMELVGEFKANFGKMEEMLKAITTSNVALSEQVTAISKSYTDLSDATKTLSADLAEAKKGIELLTTAKG